MDLTLTDGTAIKIEEKEERPEESKLRCSTRCPFFKTLEWEPSDVMGRGLMTYRCLMTNHDFGWKKNPFGSSFEIIRTAECVAKDPDPEVAPRRERYVETCGLGVLYPMGSDYTLVTR